MSRILEDEIASSPRAATYAALNDVDFLALINLANISRSGKALTGLEISRLIVLSEYRLLPPNNRTDVIALAKAEGAVDPEFAAAVIESVFLPGSTTRKNFDARKTETVSQGVIIGWGFVREKDLRMHTLIRRFPS